jgi:hypothetical protein
MIIGQEDLRFTRILQRLDQLENMDATPLMVSWMDIMRTDNKEGVLAGLDKDGNPMQPVTYRPDPKAGTKIDIASKEAAHMRLGQRASRKHDLFFGGFGPFASGWNNNLSWLEYRRSTGPPLAPRFQFSRVITNLLTAYKPLRPDGTNHWEAWAYWDQVVSPTGFSFLPVHFNGEPLGTFGPSIKRDLRGLRPVGRKKAEDAFRAWALDLLRATGI